MFFLLFSVVDPDLVISFDPVFKRDGSVSGFFEQPNTRFENRTSLSLFIDKGYLYEIFWLLLGHIVFAANWMIENLEEQIN